VKCSNKEGGCSWEGELRELQPHTSKCTTEMVPCKYASVGCKTKVLKKNLSSHEEACTVEHLKMAIEKVNELSSDIKALKLKCQAVSAVKTLPVTFKMTGFEHHRRSRTIWDSPPFCTHSRGYKLYLRVNNFGSDGHGNKSIAVKVCLQHGEYDDELIWPFSAVVSFWLLNQDNNVSHKFGSAKFMERRESEKNTRVSAAVGKSTAGWGVNDLLLYSEPDFLSYVQDDCMVHFEQH